MLDFLKKANLVNEAQLRTVMAVSPENVPRLKIKAPEVLSIYDTKYSDQTLLFLDQLSRGVFEKFRYILLDLSLLREITAAAAVILFAHITRSQCTCPRAAFPFRDQVIDIDFGENRSIRDFFMQSYLYEAIRSGGEKKLENLWKSEAIPFKTNNQPYKKHVEVVRWLKKYYGYLPPRMSAAIQEALLNITHHSYSYHKNMKQPLDPFMVNRWWQYAIIETIDGKQRLTFMIYDMGHGIPGVAKLAAKSKDDAGIIREAMVRGFSSTGLAGRGNGSADILKPIRQQEKSDTLYIFSNNGEVGFKYDEVAVQRNNRHSVGGTLLEWSFSI